MTAKLTEDIALLACFETPLEAAFTTLELPLEVTPVEFAFVDSKDSRINNAT